MQIEKQEFFRAAFQQFCEKTCAFCDMAALTRSIHAHSPVLHFF
jgi:hypothetical protein